MEVVSVSLRLVLLILVVIDKGYGSTPEPPPPPSSPLLPPVPPSSSPLSSSSSETESEESASERVPFLLMELLKLLHQQERGSKDPEIHDDEGADGHLSFSQALEGLSSVRSCNTWMLLFLLESEEEKQQLQRELSQTKEEVLQLRQTVERLSSERSSNTRLLHILLESEEEKQKLQGELRQTKEELLQLRQKDEAMKEEKKECHLVLPPLPAHRLPQGLSNPYDLFIPKEDLVRVKEDLFDSIEEMKMGIEYYQISGDSDPDGQKQGWPPKDCYDLFHFAGERRSAVYTIYPQGGAREDKRVWCDMGEAEEKTGGGGGGGGQGGGWTVILNRMLLPTQVDFNRDWIQYKIGFGDPETEYWIGNDVLHLLTTGGKPQTLLVEMEDFDGIKKFALYGEFSVGGEDQNFRLNVGNFSSSSTAGDSMALHNAMEFSTKDKDNDKKSGHCAPARKGGFWFNSCSRATPTSPIVGKGKSYLQMRWWHFHNDETTLKNLQMKIHPLY